MTHSLTIAVSLGEDYAGKSLLAQLFDKNGQAVTGQLSSGFSEIGGGNYLWYYSQFPAGFMGAVAFADSGDPATVLAVVSLNPADFDDHHEISITTGTSPVRIRTGVR